ncbi:hypothetical protein EB118_19175 [bacterium]|nr:hypothetical protein [bacterium]NDD83690.1 hypothetical protein [bacterium]NDG32185.1 hypothetical protein [bacterium]
MSGTLLLSGGGVKAIAFIGALKKLGELEYKFNKYITVSAGSIVGLLCIIGYTPDELISKVYSTDFTELVELRLNNVVKKYGLDSGKRVIGWLERLMMEKGFSSDMTFSQLYSKTQLHYQVLTTNLNTRTQTTFDYLVTPDVQVLRAIRMSIGIPFVYTIRKYKGDIHVDGSLLSNYPVHLITTSDPLAIGLRLVPEQTSRKDIHDILEYITNILSCLVNSRMPPERSYTINIHTGGNAVQFDIGKTQKETLVEQGYNSVERHFN